MNDNAITVSDIDHVFIGEDGKKTDVLKNISFSVGHGEFFTILGPSGCGKSTLLRALAGIMKPMHGKITFASDEHQAGISMIFQSFAIFPWLTVHQNVEFGLKMKDVSPKERAVLVREHIHEMGLAGFEHAYPKELSGGMKQRVGIARALTMRPQILLMDEPFSALDAFTADRLRQDVGRIWLQDKMTVVMVTHLVDEAVEMSDRVLVMTPRPGRVEQMLDITLPRPRNKRSVEFFKLVDTINELVKV